MTIDREPKEPAASRTTAGAPRSLPRRLAAVSILLATALLVSFGYYLMLDDKKASNCDFIEYWSIGQQMAQGGDLYDPAAIYRLEHSRGMEGSEPLVSLSPPIALYLFWPLGHMGAALGLLFWKMLLLGCAAASMGLLWLLHGRPPTLWHVLLFAFPPVICNLMAGQLGIFFLLELSLFLTLRERRPWLAGAALVLLALKPHLFLPLALALALECLRRRDLRIPGGFLLALALSCGLSSLLAPEAWRQYGAMLGVARVMEVPLPTLGSALRFAVAREARWLEFLPEALACLWTLWYGWRRRQMWRWDREGMLVLLVSVCGAPYGFYSDQAVLFPAVLVGIYAAERSVSSWLLLGVLSAAGYVGLLLTIQLPSPFYLWTAPAWLLWYLYATRWASGRRLSARGCVWPEEQ